ncbi:hypothetical protein D3C77_351310 [compost metagenome]
MARAGDLALLQVARDSGEIVEGALAVLAQGRLVPLRPELAAAADVGLDEDAAVLEPQLAHLGLVGGREAGLEAAIAEQDGRAGPVHRQVLRAGDEVGDLGPVGRGRLELLDHMGRGVELGGGRLQLGQDAGGDLGQAERRRGQEALRGDEDPALGLGAVAQPHGAVGGDGDVGRGPARALRGEALQRAHDIVGDHRHHAVLEHAHALQRLARPRREEGRGGGGVITRFVQCGQRQGQQRTGDVGLAAEGPGLVGREDQLAVHHAFDADPLGQGQLVGLAVGAKRPGLGAEGVQRAAEQHRLDRPGLVAQHHGGDAVAAVALLAAIDLGRLRQGLAARQGFDDVGIARLRQAARAEVRGDQQGVAVQPRDAVLALGDDEAAPVLWSDEGLGRQVELADRDGVLAAVRQVDQAAGLVRRQAVGALEHPVAALRLRQGVDVQQGLPLRRGAAVAVQRRTAPHALGIGRVLPEVADALAQEAGHGDAVGGGQDGLGLLAEGLIAPVAGQGRQGLFVRGRDKGLGLGAVDRLQRQMVVGGLDPLGRQVAREVRRRRGRGDDGGRIGRRTGQGRRRGGHDQHRQGS